MSVSRKIRGITIEFGADTTELMKGLSEIEHKGRKISTAYKDINKLLKFDPRNVEVLKQKQVELLNAISQSKDKIEHLKKIQADMAKNGVDENSEQYKALRREIIDTEKALSNYEKTLERTNQDIEAETTGLRSVTEAWKNKMEALKNAGAKLQKIGDSVSSVGKKLTVGLTLPLTVMGKQGLNAFKDFEDGLIGVAKTTDMSGTELKNFGDQVHIMAKRLPVATTELLGVAEIAGQLGVENKNLLKFSETMVQMGLTTNLSSEEASTALARFSNIMGTSQGEVSRLGSAIVDLGNNFATTEREIVEMGLRIAGTGKQVGLTEGEVFGLATALSSLGLEAQAGGSSISRVMQKINTSVIEGGESVKHWAKISGISVEEFSKAWKTKPVEALALFLKGLNGVKESGGNTIGVLEELEITAIREVDAVFRLASNTDLLTKATEKGNEAFREDIALKKEADKRNESYSGRMQKLKNRIFELSVEIGERLLPYIESITDKVSGWIEYFDSLDSETKDLIVRLGIFAVAIGPILTIGGKLVSIFGSIIKVAGMLGSALSATQAGATIATGGLTAIKGGLIALAPGATIVAGVVAGAYGIYEAYKYMSSSSLAEVNLFSSGVSEETKKAVGEFLKISENADNTLKETFWSGRKITQENIDGIVSSFASMRERIVSELSLQKDEALQNLRELVDNSKSLTQEERYNMITQVQGMYDERLTYIQTKEAEIQAILNTASQEKRALTQEEYNTIQTIRNNMKDEGVKTLSATEEEYKIIMQRMKDNAGVLSAEQSAEVVKNSLLQKEESIKNAEIEYNERIRFAEQLRATGGQKASETADKIIEEAKRQKDGTIAEATSMHDNVIAKAKEQAGEHVKYVNWETGEIKNEWEVLKTNIGDTLTNIGGGIKSWATTAWGDVKTFTENTGRDLGAFFKKTGTDVWNWASGIAGDVKNSWDNLKKNTSDTFNNLKNTIGGGVKTAWETASGWVDKLKNAFDFNWSLPKIKLPSLKVWTEPGLLGIPIPKFSINWHRDGGIFKTPTVLPTLNGLHGFAEPSTGGEAILPLNKLPSLMAEAIEKSYLNKTQTIINYVMLDGKVIAKEVTTNVDRNFSKNSSRFETAGGLL